MFYEHHGTVMRAMKRLQVFGEIDGRSQKYPNTLICHHLSPWLSANRSDTMNLSGKICITLKIKYVCVHR